MIKIVGANSEFEFNSSQDTLLVNNKPVHFEIEKGIDGEYFLIDGNVRHSMDVVRANFDKKEFEIRLNGTLYSFKVKDRFDAMLKDLGIELKAEELAKDIQAPMPGLVLSVNVKVGSVIKKGETIVVLEAMKMENSIKATFDGVVKSIPVSVGQAVEKKQVLVLFE